MIRRDLTSALGEALKRYPVVTLTGPRQSGKTTLAKTVADKPYVNLEAPDVRQFALHDPRAFLAQYPEGAILDEVQRVPELLSYVQVDVDAAQRTGRWVLTGSHQPQLRQALAQSLAGRTALLHLLPFSLGELAACGRRLDLDMVLVGGFFPRLYEADIPPHQFHGDYLSTYVERDVRQLVNVRDLAAFQRFLGLVAGRVGQTLNYTALGADAGINETTAKAWCGALEASHVASLLRPWFANIGKRLVKSPKLYLMDVGMAAQLIGCTSASHLASHPQRGHLFENMMVMEAVKILAHHASPARLHLFATPTHEVDLLVEANGHTLAVEIKAGRTVADDWFRHLAHVADIAALRVDQRLVVYGGDDEQIRQAGTVCPWWRFPVRLLEWLRDHDALPEVPDFKVLERRLHECFARQDATG